ncbi:helix-turn-helix domain-containing protein [Sphingopyxis sp. SE2]|uniref:helix-turn-helix domain-containing protein n=1 Tax=Sphingopyxis sp. SE2 TaxID=1586240 RepID=UPI0028C26D0F|nr:helix-turn-helix domain-containing protein [Sphingopyxis sp. SE2]MDT7527557.1 helix-turn-helix domain-containing protein [Sphingopyxis sp. SE2]
MDDSPHDPAHIPAPGSYHWTPRLQREFLEAFATNGSVKISAAKVGMSPSAVYQLKQRPEGAAFRLGCAAALLIARGRLVDEPPARDLGA